MKNTRVYGAGLLLCAFGLLTVRPVAPLDASLRFAELEPHAAAGSSYQFRRLLERAETFPHPQARSHFSAAALQRVPAHLRKQAERELVERLVVWLAADRTSAAAAGGLGVLHDQLEQLERELLFETDSGGRVRLDDMGDPILLGIPEFDRDYDEWSALVSAAVEQSRAGFSPHKALVKQEIAVTAAALGIDATAHNQYITEMLRRQYERHAHEQHLLVQHARNRFIAGRRRDTYSLRRKSEAETATAIQDSVLESTQEQVDVAQRLLRESLQAALEAQARPQLEHASAHETEVQAVIDEGLALWAEAEQELLAARADWERSGAKVYRDGETSWQAAFDELKQRQTAWLAELAEIITNTEEYWAEQVQAFTGEYNATVRRVQQMTSTTGAQFAHEIQAVTALLTQQDGYYRAAVKQIAHFEALLMRAEAKLLSIREDAPHSELWNTTQELQPYRAELAYWRKARDEFQRSGAALHEHLTALEEEALALGGAELSNDARMELQWVQTLVNRAETELGVAEAVAAYALDGSSNRPTHAETEREYRDAREELQRAHSGVQQHAALLHELTDALNGLSTAVQASKEDVTAERELLEARQSEYYRVLETWGDLSADSLLGQVNQHVAAVAAYYGGEKAMLFATWLAAEEQLERSALHDSSSELAEVLRHGAAEDAPEHPGAEQHPVPNGGLPALRDLYEARNVLRLFTLNENAGDLSADLWNLIAHLSPLTAGLELSGELARLEQVAGALHGTSAAVPQGSLQAVRITVDELIDIVAAEVEHREYAIALLDSDAPWTQQELEDEIATLRALRNAAAHAELVHQLEKRHAIAEAALWLRDSDGGFSDGERLVPKGRALEIAAFLERLHGARFSTAELQEAVSGLASLHEQVESIVPQEYQEGPGVAGRYLEYFTADGLDYARAPRGGDELSSKLYDARIAVLERYGAVASATAYILRTAVVQEFAAKLAAHTGVALEVADGTEGVTAPSGDIHYVAEDDLYAFEQSLAGLEDADLSDRDYESLPDHAFGFAVGLPRAIEIALREFFTAYRDPFAVLKRGEGLTVTVDRRPAAIAMLRDAIQLAEAPPSAFYAEIEDAFHYAAQAEASVDQAAAEVVRHRSDKQRILSELNSAAWNREQYYSTIVVPARAAVEIQEKRYHQAVASYREAQQHFATKSALYAEKRRQWGDLLTAYRAAESGSRKARAVHEYASDGYTVYGFDPLEIREARQAEYERLAAIYTGLETILAENAGGDQSGVSDYRLTELHERQEELVELQSYAAVLEETLFEVIEGVRRERDTAALDFGDVIAGVFRVDLSASQVTPMRELSRVELSDYRHLTAEQMLDEERLATYLADGSYLRDAELFGITLLHSGNPGTLLRDFGYAFYHEMQSFGGYDLEVDAVNDGALRRLISERRIISGGGSRSQIRAYAAREAERGFNRVRANTAHHRLYALYKQLMLADLVPAATRYIQNDLSAAR